jgi:hypothetical protein
MYGEWAANHCWAASENLTLGAIVQLPLAALIAQAGQSMCPGVCVEAVELTERSEVTALLWKTRNKVGIAGNALGTSPETLHVAPKVGQTFGSANKYIGD